MDDLFKINFEVYSVFTLGIDQNICILPKYKHAI